MDRMVSRRSALAQVAAIVTAAVAWTGRTEAQQPTPITVYKDPSCGCCGKWVEHMQASGFAPTVTHTDMTAIKTKYKVAARLQSCHTTVVGSYVIEGHVPAADVKKLLARKPRGILGLTIPGMPQSAPGMDLKPFQPYTVLTFDGKGATTVFAQHDKG